MNDCLVILLGLAGVFFGIPILAYVTTKMVRYGWLRAGQNFKAQHSEEKTDGESP